jgi:hypothetical protein
LNSAKGFANPIDSRLPDKPFVLGAFPENMLARGPDEAQMPASSVRITICILTYKNAAQRKPINNRFTQFAVNQAAPTKR